MNLVGLGEFKELLGFEYKKILAKKSMRVFFLIGIVFTFFRSILYINERGGGLSGVNHFFALADTTILIIFFLTSLCMAPLFSEEYSTRVDKLILASKYGKNKAIIAKITVGLSMAIGLFGIFWLVMYLGVLCRGGFGTSTAEEWRALSIYSTCALMGNVFATAFYMLFSAKLKSPYSALVSSFVLFIGSRILYLPQSSGLVKGITQLLPMQMANNRAIFSDFIYAIGGIKLATYECIPLVALGGSVMLLFVVYHVAKNHQSA